MNKVVNMGKNTMAPLKIDPSAIRTLAELLNETGLNEIEIAEGETRIRVVKTAGVATYAAAPAMAVAQPAPEAVKAEISHDKHPGAVKSPMVGTAYLQQEPGSPKFASVGQPVKAGDTLVIIEAMKVMNPIKAERGGVVKAILIEDAAPVEFGEVMFIIE